MRYPGMILAETAQFHDSFKPNMGRLQKKMLKKAEWHELVNKESRDEAKKYTSAPPTKKSTSSSKVGRKEDDAPFQFRKKHVKPELLLQLGIKVVEELKK